MLSRMGLGSQTQSCEGNAELKEPKWERTISLRDGRFFFVLFSTHFQVSWSQRSKVGADSTPERSQEVGGVMCSAPPKKKQHKNSLWICPMIQFLQHSGAKI